jgi:hypothetical protein
MTREPRMNRREFLGRPDISALSLPAAAIVVGKAEGDEVLASLKPRAR